MTSTASMKACFGKSKRPLCPCAKPWWIRAWTHSTTIGLWVGSNLYPTEGVIAFVVSEDAQRAVHFTEHFFNQQLDMYEGALTETFDITAHAQAATLIHEFSHLFSNT